MWAWAAVRAYTMVKAARYGLFVDMWCRLYYDDKKAREVEVLYLNGIMCLEIQVIKIKKIQVTCSCILKYAKKCKLIGEKMM